MNTFELHAMIRKQKDDATIRFLASIVITSAILAFAATAIWMAWIAH